MRTAQGMRILGLDYGDRRIGVAVSDELGITARGMATIVRRGLKRDLDELERIIGTCRAEKIVIGFPVRLDGTAGIQCEKVDRFIRALEKRFTLPVERWDETLSTWQAEEILSEALVIIKKTNTAVDRLAAAIILQGYLNKDKRNIRSE
jgi:putative Holliday junction resolvase